MHPQAVWPDAFSIPNVWAFDLTSYSWSELPDLPDHRAGGGAAVLGNQLHFFGGGQSRPWSEVSVSHNDIASACQVTSKIKEMFESRILGAKSTSACVF